MPALRRTAYVVFGLAGLALFARASLANGADGIPGNVGDARFVLYVCEHWYKVFTGRASWLSPPILYPTRDVLGYSEALFALAAPYSVLRRAGLDPFAAYQLVVLALPLSAYAGALWLLRRGLGATPFASVVGALLFAYSSPMATSMDHAQLQAVAFVPYLLMFVLRYLASFGAPGRAATASGIGFSLGFALLAYTCFYVAWFLVLYAFLAVLLLGGALLARRRRDVLAGWARLARRRWRSLATTAAVLGVAMIPFVVTYAPVLRLFGRRLYDEEVLVFLPRPIDLVNVGFDNVIWGALLRKVGPALDARPGFWEIDKGLPLALLLLVSAVGAHLLLRLRTAPRPISRPPPEPSALVPPALVPAAVALCLALVAVGWALMLRFGDRSAWWLVYRWFPGGGAVRAAFRSNILLVLLVAVAAAHGLDAIADRLRARYGAAALVALWLFAAFLVVEEQSGRRRDVLSKRAERVLLASAPPPPAQCRAMVVTAEKDLDDGWWAPLQLHAMLVSQKFDIPTVNGYSGWTPEPWNLHHPTAPGYRERVRIWAARYGVLDGLCAYHFDARAWEPFEAGTPAASPALAR